MFHMPRPDVSMIGFDPLHYLDGSFGPKVEQLPDLVFQGTFTGPPPQWWKTMVSTCFSRHFVAESQHDRKLRGSAHAPCRGLGECPCRCPTGYTARVVHWDQGVRRGSLVAPAVFPVTKLWSLLWLSAMTKGPPASKMIRVRTSLALTKVLS